MERRAYTQKKVEEVEVTKEDFKLAFPEIYREIFEEGRKVGARGSAQASDIAADMGTKLKSAQKEEVEGAGAKLSRLVNQRIAEKGLPYRDAMLEVARENPRLAEAYRKEIGG